MHFRRQLRSQTSCYLPRLSGRPFRDVFSCGVPVLVACIVVRALCSLFAFIEATSTIDGLCAVIKYAFHFTRIKDGHLRVLALQVRRLFYTRSTHVCFT